MRTETFDTPGPLVVDVRLPSGEISLVAIDEPRAYVELDATHDSDELRQIIDNARVDLRPRGDGHELVVDVHQKRFRFFDFMRGDIIVRVRAPRGSDVEVSTASADTSVRGEWGSLEAETASGDVYVDSLSGNAEVKAASADVQLREIAGRATVNTASGDVEIRQVGGDAIVRSASGDVEIDEALSSVTIQTASGDQRVGAVTSGRVTLQSASGDQTVGVRRGTRVFIDARTMSGDTTTELAVGDEPAEGDGPTVELRATAMSGDINIVRA
jgi:DUF4097 and DUF4098 domain-containing protein YvlB